MLLKSSSAPAIQTSLSTLPDSPSREFDTIGHNKVSVHARHHHLGVSSFSCNTTPISRFAFTFSQFDPEPNNLRPKEFRRALSESNLEGLASSSFDLDQLCCLNKSTGYRYKHHKSMLHSVPSLSIYSSNDECEEDEKELEREALGKNEECLARSVTIGDSIEATGSGEFSFVKMTMNLIEEDCKEEEDSSHGLPQNMGTEEEAEPLSRPMYLATGFGIGGGDAVGFTPESYDVTGNFEEYYRRRIGEDPCNPLFLRNYAQLMQSKGDLVTAEECSFRATLADPQDGEILLQYAKLVWELHQDQDRASSYFKRAAQASPHDSNVLAAYARFLWELDGEEEDRSENDSIKSVEHEDLAELQNSVLKEEKEQVRPSLRREAGLLINVAGNGGGNDRLPIDNSGEEENLEEYYKRMVHEDPCNPLFLRNYAQLLHQTKGDLQGAEEYYSRAILADPRDGEIISQYAKLVWEHHHDRDRATSYFERAVQATPCDSHVLAAYASFLWEMDDDDNDNECSAKGEEIHMPHFCGGLASSANA